MKFIKINLKNTLISFAVLIIMTMFITILSYFNLISNTVVNIIFYIIPFISFTIGGYLTGKNTNKKGYLEGLKFSVFPLIFVFLFNLIFTSKIFITGDLILYSIIIFSSIIGSILGINKKL